MATQYIVPIPASIVVAANTGSVAVISHTTFDRQLFDDLDEVFYNTGEFAEEITYRYRNGCVQTLQAIFDEEHSSIDIATEAPVIVSEPMFHAHADKFIYSPDKGDSVIIRNREFNVKETRSDGTGLMVVTLLRD